MDADPVITEYVPTGHSMQFSAPLALWYVPAGSCGRGPVSEDSTSCGHEVST